MTENKALELHFADDCTVFELKYEYTDYTGYEKYGIITALTEEELVNKYGALLDRYKPYVVLDLAFAEVRDEFKRNEKKHEMRNYRGHIFDIYDDFEVHHPEYASPDCVEQLIRDEENEKLLNAIKTLTPLQQQRLIKHYFWGSSIRTIAEEEGTDHKTVHESIAASLKKLKKLLKNTPPNGFSQ